MLRRLRIENLVLIRSAELSFAPGLNVITGETGAGKTILAQAIGLEGDLVEPSREVVGRGRARQALDLSHDHRACLLGDLPELVGRGERARSRRGWSGVGGAGRAARGRAAASGQDGGCDSGDEESGGAGHAIRLATERRRSRTYPAAGCAASPV